MQDEVIKKYKIVLEYVDKNCRPSDDYKVLYIDLQKCEEDVIEKYKLIIQEILQPFEKGGVVKLFELFNHDIVVIFNKKDMDGINSCLVKIKFLLNKEDLVKENSSLEDCNIVVFFDLKNDKQEFFNKLAASECIEHKNHKAIDEVSKVSFFNSRNKFEKKKMTTEMLAKVQNIISVADFTSFIRRQSICAVIGKSKPQRVFEEVFVSIPDMRDYLLPGVEITSNSWLFLALTEMLDKKVLEIISRHDDGALKGNFSVNINVSTILSDEFLRFDDTISSNMRSSIVLEMQLVDIFSDIRSFILAKTFAQTRGYKICIDGITIDKLQYINRKGLDCDLLKIVWHPSLPKVLSEDKHFMDYMNKAERAKIILCRIDDAEAINVGNSLGINLYQGRYVQRLLNASNM